MKKIYYAMMLMAGVALTSCDPSIANEGTADSSELSKDALDGLIKFTQADSEGKTAADGNYIHYTTSPSTIVSIYTKSDDGTEKVLAHGTSGDFSIVPKRGASTQQTVNIRVANQDGQMTETTKTFTVYVPTELPAELKLLLGEEGSKKWGWAEDGYDVWGNAGNTGSGATFSAYNVDGHWWGVTESAELAESQMGHCAGDENNGKKYAATGSYMLFDEDGNLTTCTADGSTIVKTTYSLDDYDATRASGWQIAKLNTKDAAVLWPYSINENGKKVTSFDVMYLDKNHLVLTYTKGNAAGSWGEITYWRFKNLSPSQDALEGNDKWYWASDGYECWGNAGNTGGGASFAWNNVDGKWWGVTSGADLSGQLQHSGGVDYGDADNDAYMTFKDGTVTTYNRDGSKVIRKSLYTVDFYSERKNGWAIGELVTADVGLLFPWSINEGGKSVKVFDVMYMDGGNMTLVYTKGNAAGSWGEITYWRFSSKH